MLLRSDINHFFHLFLILLFAKHIKIRILFQLCTLQLLVYVFHDMVFDKGDIKLSSFLSNDWKGLSKHKVHLCIHFEKIPFCSNFMRSDFIEVARKNRKMRVQSRIFGYDESKRQIISKVIHEFEAVNYLNTSVSFVWK